MSARDDVASGDESRRAASEPSADRRQVGEGPLADEARRDAGKGLFANDARASDVPPARHRRRIGCWLVLLALALAAVGHWAYWYRSRSHEMAPAASRLLRERGELPVRLWIPYPHQNLGALGRAVGRPREVLEAAARLAGLPEPTLPQLGGFGIPASRELLVAASADGRQVVAAIRLYPLSAALARLAGVVARNPWLAGGVVKVRGEPARVSWDGLTWRVRSDGVAGGEIASRQDNGGGDDRPALALLELAQAAPPLPAGRYPLRREAGDLVVRLGAPVAEPPSGGPPPRVILVWAERRASRAEALLLMEGGREGLLASLPAAAAWAQPDGALRVLPGGSILRQLTDLRARPFGGGELAATERTAAARAEELAPVWLPLARGESRPPLALGAWLAIEPAAEQAERLHQLLGEIPILGAAEAQRWGDVATVLRAARGYRTLSCWLAEDGAGGELRLSAGAASAPRQ